MGAPTLHRYQLAAVDWLWAKDRAGLFLDMGLGKTAIVLSAFEDAHLPALVVAPKRAAEHTWPTEAGLWRPDLSLSLAAGPARHRIDALRSGSEVTVIGRDNLGDAVTAQDEGMRWKTVVLDELSSFKSPSSQRFKSARKLCRPARFVWGLTGTPAPNGLLDLWSQSYLIDGGEALGPTITRYRKHWFRPTLWMNGYAVAWEPIPAAEDEIHELLSRRCLSMRALDKLDLPPVTYNRVKVPLPERARKAYKDMLTELVADVRDPDSPTRKRVHTAAGAAVATGKLSQITAGFLYPDAEESTAEPTRLHDAKTEALTEILEGVGSPVLVFYRFKAELASLRAIPGARCITEPGVIDAWNRGEVPLLLAHPASAGHGLNLQHGGHTIVWTTLDWSLELWQQANARLARQGQKHPVVVHVLEAPDTIDGTIFRRLSEKTGVQETLMTYLEGRNK